MGKINIESLDLEILIRDGETFGLGSTTFSENEGYNYLTDMYQDRINLEAKDDNEIRRCLEESKNYNSECSTQLEAVNSILDFWCMEPLKEIDAVLVFSSLVDALNHFKNIDDEFIVFYVDDNDNVKM